MKINTDSWHYKFIDTVDTTHLHKKNLCPYVRQLLKCMFLTLIGVVVGVVLGIALGFFLLTPIFAWSIGFDVVQAFLLSIGWLVVGAVTLKQCRGWRVSWNKNLFTLPTRQPREPGIFSIWLTAKHDKICPSLEFTDEY